MRKVWGIGQALRRHGSVVLVLAVVFSLSAIVRVSADIGVAAVSPSDSATTFTFAHVPDTQQEVMQDGTPLLTARYQWLSDNQQALNLKFIAQTGDLVNWGVADPVQFTRASLATNILDNSGVPYSYAIGNHDGAAVQVGGSAAPGNVHDNLRNTALFNQTFPVSRFKNVEGTFEPNKVDNMYQTFTAGGLNWLVLTHEMWPRQTVLDWMKQVIAAHPTYNVIVSTHAFIDNSGALPTAGNYGDQNAQVEWNQVISQYPNIKFVISGHYGPTGNYGGYDYQEATGVHGNKVAEILTAYHSSFQDHVRLLKIDTAHGTMSSSVYAPLSTNSAYPSGYITDSASNFVATGMNWIQPDGSTGTPITPTVSTAPTNVSATAGNAQATVSFTAPSSNGGSAITGYTVTSNPGNITATSTGSPVTVTGLTNGTAYTFTVTATNAVGTSVASNASPAVTPSVPVTASQELLPDPGFEAGNGGWTPFSVGTLSTVTSPVHGGAKALRVAGPNASPTLVGLTQNTVVSNSLAGTAYTAQCYVQPTAANLNVRIRFLEYTQNFSSNTHFDANDMAISNLPLNTWTLVKTTVTAAKSGERMIPQVYSTNETSATGSIIYDDCSVTTNVPVSLPGAPTNVSSTAGNAQATVSFTAPSSSGGSAITGYTVTAMPGGATATGTNSPITITGLTNGTAYTFTVTATNAAGIGAPSNSSASVTPVAPVTVPTAPTNVMAAPQDGAASISFVPGNAGGSPVTSYTVTSTPDGITATGTASPITITGLTNGTAYTFTVVATNVAGTSQASNSSASITPSPVPDAPTGLIAQPSDQRVVLTWTAPTLAPGAPAITTYAVETSLSGSGIWVPYDVDGALTQTTTTVIGLTNGTSYDFRVRAVSIIGQSLPSATATAVPAPVAPDAPTNVSATAGNGQATVSFTAPAYTGGTAVTGYTVTSTPDGVTATGTNSPITITGLTSGTSYTFTVTATNAVGTSVSSAPSAPVTPYSVPDAPTNVSATAGNGSALVTFTAPANNGGAAITGYSVTSSPDSITASTTGTAVTLTGLTNGTAYTFTVTATNVAGASMASAPSVPVTPTPPPAIAPDAPTNVSATAGNGQATVSFTAPINAGTAPITTYTVTSNPDTITSTGVHSPITLTGLTNGTAYTFTVTATSQDGTSVASTASTAVTPAAPTALVPGAPTNVSATAGNGSALVTFTAPTDNGGSPITGYRVTSAPGTIVASGTSSPITVSGLSNGIAYTFTVTAINAVGSSTPSAASPGVTPVQELLPDPGFETGFGGWTPFSVGTFSTVTSPVHGGAKALKVAATASSINLVGLTQNTVITNTVLGKSYTAQCYVQPTSANLNVRIRFLEYTQNFSSNTHFDANEMYVSSLPLNTWTLMKTTVTAVKPGERMIPQIYSTNETTNTGSLLYDDCSITAN